MRVYEKVRAYIQEYGIKQITVAKRAGIPNNTFNAILNGKRTLYADDLRAICLALGVSPEVFIEVCSEEAEQPKKSERNWSMTEELAGTRPININLAIANLKTRSKDLDDYAWIMERVNKTDVSTDADFQHRFTRFYVLRRNATQQKAYYDLLEACKKRVGVRFTEVLRTLYEATGWVEASFSSKLLATINPDMPIWDSICIMRAWSRCCKELTVCCFLLAFSLSTLRALRGNMGKRTTRHSLPTVRWQASRNHRTKLLKKLETS